MFSTFFFRKPTLIAVAIGITLLFGCSSKTDQIEGNVKDVFGSPLSDVSVSIENSAFNTKTNGSGSFGIDYVPGEFVVRFAKEGFTSHLLELNLHQKENYPTGDVILYPSPSKEGMFFVDHQKKELFALSLNSSLKSQLPRHKDDGTKVRVLGATNEFIPVFYTGDLQFISTATTEYTLHKVRADDFAISEIKYSFGGNKIHYLAQPPESIVRMGTEEVLVRTVELDPGVYTWVPYGYNPMTGTGPFFDKLAYTFSVAKEEISKISNEQSSINTAPKLTVSSLSKPEQYTAVPNKTHMSQLQCAEQSQFDEMILGKNGIDSLYIKICPNDLHDIKIYYTPEIVSGELNMATWIEAGNESTLIQPIIKVSKTENFFLHEPRKKNITEYVGGLLDHPEKFDYLVIHYKTKDSLAYQYFLNATKSIPTE